MRSVPGPITAHPRKGSLSYPETGAGLELRSFHRVRFSRRCLFLLANISRIGRERLPDGHSTRLPRLWKLYKYVGELDR